MSAHKMCCCLLISYSYYRKTRKILNIWKRVVHQVTFLFPTFSIFIIPNFIAFTLISLCGELQLLIYIAGGFSADLLMTPNLETYFCFTFFYWPCWWHECRCLLHFRGNPLSVFFLTFRCIHASPSQSQYNFSGICRSIKIRLC
jgi:hypothetical protein